MQEFAQKNANFFFKVFKFVYNNVCIYKKKVLLLQRK